MKIKLFSGLSSLAMAFTTANAGGDELTFGPRLTASSEIEKYDIDSASATTTQNQRLQLGLNFEKKSRASSQSLNGDIGVLNHNGNFDYSSLTRAINGNFTMLGQSSSLGVNLGSNKNSSYSDAIENVSISNTSLEYFNNSLSLDVSKYLTKRNTVGISASYFTAETQSQDIVIVSSDTYQVGLSLKMQPNNRTSLNSSLQQSRVNYNHVDYQLTTSQINVGGNRQASARLTVAASLGAHVTEQSINNTSLNKGNLASMSVSYLAGQRSTISLVANKELQTSNFGNVVDKQTIRSNYVYKLTNRASVSGAVSFGFLKELGLATQQRQFSQMNISFSQIITRTIALNESVSYGNEQIKNQTFNSDTWRASLQVQYSPKTRL